MRQHTAFQGRIQDFKLRGGGAHLKKLCRVEGGAKIFGVFRVKNHDFMPKNHIYANCRGRREKLWGISCEKSRFYAQKNLFFPILGGGGMRRVRPPPLDPPLHLQFLYFPAEFDAFFFFVYSKKSVCLFTIEFLTKISKIFYFVDLKISEICVFPLNSL